MSKICITIIFLLLLAVHCHSASGAAVRSRRSETGGEASSRKKRKQGKTRKAKVSLEEYPPWKSSTASDGVCNGFFTVLAEREPWKTRGKEPCADTFGKQDPFLRVLSAQMQEMGQTLTIFTTYIPSKEDVYSCSLYDYPNLELKNFDAEALMIEYGLEEVIIFFNQYSLTEYTRTSDVLRLLLAHKYAMTYIDPDVHFVDYNANRFFKEFVGAAVWNEVQCSLEMTNCAFCLSKEPLESLIAFMKYRILFGSKSYLYAELGPAMFQKVLMNNYAIMMYSQNNPEEEVVEDVAAGIKKYNHSMLHITSTIRLFLVENSRPNGGDVITFLHDLRRAAGLKPLTLPPTGRGVEDLLAQYKAFIRNNFFDAKGVDAAGQVLDTLANILGNYQEVQEGKITANNEWVRLLSPRNSMENIYAEITALSAYIMKVSEESSPRYQAARAKYLAIKDKYYGMLDHRKLASVKISAIGGASPPAVASNDGPTRRLHRGQAVEQTVVHDGTQRARK